MGEALATASIESAIGTLRVAATAEGLVRIALPRSGGAGFEGWFQRALPDAERVRWLPALDTAIRELEEYFSGARRAFRVSTDLRGTPFQRSVWEEIARIPYAQTRTYGQIARAVNRPAACRATGAAAGANPLPLVIPCHRVIASHGRLGGYGGGIETKQKLLAFEQGTARADLV